MAVVNGIERDRTSQETTFAVTNFTEDFTLDANGTVDVVADFLCTLVRELARKGIINADVTA